MEQENLGTTEPFKYEIINMNDHQFKKTKWNGIDVIQDEMTGYFNASRVCSLYHKRFNDWKSNKGTIEYLSIAQKLYNLSIEFTDAEISAPETSGYLTRFLMYQYTLKGNDLATYSELQGYYLSPDIFHDVCYWADKEYAAKVAYMLNLINENNRLKNKTLENDIEKLKYEHEIICAKLDEKTSENLLLQSQIHDLTTPKNKLIPSYLYAKQYGNYFQLKYKQTNPENIKSNIRQIELINARDVKIDFIYHANKLGLIQNIKSKNLCKLEDIDIVFEMLGKLKNNTFDIHEYQNINDLIDAELTKLRSLPSTQQRKGKILELEYSRKNGTIPWMFTSSTILNRYNEIHLDSGIDFVKIDNEKITTIGQVKMKNNTYITISDIDTFLSKCKEDKFKDCNKELVLMNCKVSKKFKSKMSEYGINLNILSEQL